MPNVPNILSGPSRPPLSCGKPKYLVVLLHGNESNGDEIVDLALDWAPILNKAEFLAPHAPWLSRDAGEKRQWTYPVDGRQLPDNDASAVVAKLQIYLDDVLSKRRLEDAQLALVGFAQGASIALRAGLARPRPIGAIVTVSRSVDDFAGAFESPPSTPPVLLAEGEIGPDSGAMSMGEVERQLRGWKVPVERLAHPGSYFGLDDEGVNGIANYLHQALVKPASGSEHP